MANRDVRGGFKPLRYLSGLPYTGSANRYKKEASTILAVGDPVVLTGTSEADTGVALIDRAASASGTITGVVVGIEPNRTDLTKTHMAAADTGYVLVADEPNLLFVLQEDSDSSNVAITDVGRGADIIVANANTTTGISQTMLDSSTVGQAQVRIMEKYQEEGNDVGAYCRWVVMIHEHTYKATGTLI